MSKIDWWIAGFAAVAIGIGVAWHSWPAPPACPGPNCPIPTPAPCPEPPKPKPPRRPWGPRSASVEAKVGGQVAPDGKTEIQCDLPARLHQKNTGGSDGAGLCVFASMRHSGLYQGESAFSGLFDYMRKYPGGGYPQKVDQMLQRYCQEKGLPVPAYVQVQDGDLEILKLACRNGLLPAVTYSYSPSGRYNGQRIAHMVSLPHADANWFAVLDNNYIGSYEWLTPAEFAGTYGKSGWAVILLHKSPPPPPRN